MQQALQVHCKSIKDVENFVNITERLPYDINLYKGNTCIDGKSFMGLIYTLPLMPLYVDVHAQHIMDFAAHCQDYITE